MIRSRSNLHSRKAEVALYKLLAHPARLAILDALRTGEECVCHLEALLGYRQAYLSQQLAVLREAGLICDHRDGWNIYYRVIEPEIYTVLDAARIAINFPAPPDNERQRDPDCPCPKCAGKMTTNTDLLLSETNQKET